MKKTMLIFMITILFLGYWTSRAQAGEIDILLTKLVEKNILTPAEAQIIADETKLQASKDLSQAKSISAPGWSQRIKWGGDVRFRTQGDWGKSPTSNNVAGLDEQRIRERIRGRFYMEGKVNDFTYAGVRFAGGATGSRSTNDTMDGYFEKDFTMFDQYYMRFEAPSELIRKYGQYFSDLKLWAGKFAIPYEYSEMVWDSDINPTGMALQYSSPDIKLYNLPSINFYSNTGMHWLNEAANLNTDPLLFAWQMGIKTEAFGPLDSILNVAATFYNFANLKNKTPNTASAGTNTRVSERDIGGLVAVSANSALLGTYAYEFNVLDLLINIDNSKIGDWSFPHGFYADFIYNTGCHDQTMNKGALLGGYIGKKKLKEPGDWKARAEWRFIERNAIPDFMPDSDFYGFGTWQNATAANNFTNGYPAEGGTNGKGINMAFEYQLLKNTTLNFEYYWMKPIKSWDKVQPWNELQIDVVTKF
ncbi:MAG: putative porin [Candidatus Omnitrophica bacterium]|nr:putative porin [Candidatus Omnitrophota bacterium]